MKQIGMMSIEEASHRQCGGCTACCKLIPVEELSKPAGHRCTHQRTGKGCAIYAKRPHSCREWSCLWLKGTEDGGPLQLGRPDRTHYVLDEVPDLVRMTDRQTGEVRMIEVMQVWCDPKFPNAWEDPKLLAMLERQGVVALVRYDSVKGFAVFPPSTNSTGQWQRQPADGVATDMEEARKESRFAFWRQQLSAQRGASPGDPGDGASAGPESAP